MNVLPLQCRNIIPTPFPSSNKPSLERPGFQWTVSAYILKSHQYVFLLLASQGCQPVSPLLPFPPFSPARKSLQQMKIPPSQRLLCSATALLCCCHGLPALFKTSFIQECAADTKGGGRETTDWWLTLRALEGRCVSPYTDSLFG
jgi:hypothetical protein